MPIYEFYCSQCHAVFNFFSRTVNTTKRPDCPRCRRPNLERRVSRFAVSKGRPETSGDEDAAPPDFDESRMEGMMEDLAREAEGIDEDDPRKMAGLMRKLYQGTGLPVSEKMEEAIRRMEAGEDPDKIEEEMGDFLDEEDPLLGQGGERASGGLKGLVHRLKPPETDETLYDL